MKQILLTLFICFTLISICISQSLDNQLSRKGGGEIGLSFGSLWINGDIQSEILFGKSYGLHWRKGINDVWSIKVSGSHSSSFGLSYMPNTNFENAYQDIFQGYNIDNPLFLSYKTNYTSLDFINVFELTNLAPSVYLKKWNFYLGIGIGLANFSTKLNLKNESDQLYTDLIQQTGFNFTNDINTIQGRKDILSSLRTIYDDTYETPGPKKTGKFRLGDETNIQAHLIFSVGASRKISSRLNIGLEYNLRISDNDLLDGYDKNIDDKSSGNDLINSTQIVLSYNLKKSAQKQPLFWNNSWSNLDELLSEQKSQNDSLWIDDDKDGIPNHIDKQANSMSNCPVDQFGVTLDSDKDGIPDCIDPHPFFNQKELESLFEKKDLEFKENAYQKNEIRDNEISNFLSDELLNKQIAMAELSKPIYFDLNESKLNRDSKKHLLEISKILASYSDMELSIEGYASSDGQEFENIILSEERANSTKKFLVNILKVGKNRINIEHFGERNPVVTTDTDSNAFLNRRVELKLFIPQK